MFDACNRNDEYINRPGMQPHDTTADALASAALEDKLDNPGEARHERLTARMLSDDARLLAEWQGSLPSTVPHFGQICVVCSRPADVRIGDPRAPWVEHACSRHSHSLRRLLRRRVGPHFVQRMVRR